MPNNDKNKFIAALRRFSEVGGADLYDPVYQRTGYREYRGERVLASGIAKYLDDSIIPDDETGVGWYHYLPKYLVDAFVEFRAGEAWEALRKAYLRETGEWIPDLVDVHVGGIHRLIVSHKIAYLCAVLSGETWLQSKMEALFDAQQACINQAWDRFVRISYRELMPRIKNDWYRGNKGEFGETTLMTYVMAGRCMFTFLRGGDGGPSVTYVADDSDMRGIRSGPNTTKTPYAECVAMINEVSDNWDLDKMKKDENIGIE